MLLTKPAKTKYDLNFKFLKIQVCINPFFWLAAFILCLSQMNNQYGPEINFIILIAWVLAVFISIMVHEYGHALTSKYFGAKAVSVVLYAFGGLAIGTNAKTHKKRILVILNGPLAGLVLFAIFFTISKVLDPSKIPGLPPLGKQLISNFIRNMIFINLIWSLLNLVPIFPLDGGQIFYEILKMQKHKRAKYMAHKVAFISAIVLAIALLIYGDHFTIILFVYLAYENYRNMKMLDRPFY